MLKRGASHLFNSDPETKYNRAWDVDIVSRALAAADATRVEQSEFRLLKEDGAESTPLDGSDFIAYRL